MKLCGQRIIARVRYVTDPPPHYSTRRPHPLTTFHRNQAYLASLRQEPEFADRSAGDIVSRLSVDTSILGDSVTSNLSDGLRWVLLSCSLKSSSQRPHLCVRRR
jgi:hypothetical protein